MQLRLARQLAEQLMHEHGLPEDGWRFAWGHGRRTLGSASIRPRKRITDGRVVIDTIKIIRLSKHFARHNNEPVVRETILHEIAHALVGPEHGHGPAWKAKCRELGIPAERLAPPETPTAQGPPPLAVICEGCKRIVARRFRRPSASVQRRMFCKACGQATAGKLRCVPVTTNPRAAGRESGRD